MMAHREPPRVTTSEALSLIHEYAEAGVRIFGVDGFVVVPEGFIADLDLILDVSDPSTTSAEAAATARSFVQTHDRPDVIWEVWIDD